MEKISEFDSQEKITKIVQKRHEQISEIKLYYDWNNQQSYKGVVRLGQNLEKFEKIFNRNEYQLKCENEANNKPNEKNNNDKKDLISCNSEKNSEMMNKKNKKICRICFFKKYN